jgi:hypothetical protein
MADVCRLLLLLLLWLNLPAWKYKRHDLAGASFKAFCDDVSCMKTCILFFLGITQGCAADLSQPEQRQQLLQQVRDDAALPRHNTYVTVCCPAQAADAPTQAVPAACSMATCALQGCISCAP